MIKRLLKSECKLFQKAFKVFCIFAFLQPLFFSCKSLPLSSPTREGEFAQFIYKKGKTSESNYYSCDQVNILINDGDESKSAKAKVYIQKGDFIFLNINILGIELGRAEITPDSIKIINRIEKTYYFDKLKGLNTILKLDLTYNQIESLILNGIIFDDSKNLKKTKSHISENKDNYTYVYKNADMPDITSYFLKDSFQEYRIEIGDSISDFYIIAALLNYQNDRGYPKEIKLGLKKRDYNAEVNIEIGKISNDRLSNRSFIINKKYREIEF
jgi:hypothetical protein